jgi:hypothetical protein
MYCILAMCNKHINSSSINRFVYFGMLGGKVAAGSASHVPFQPCIAALIAYWFIILICIADYRCATNQLSPVYEKLHQPPAAEVGDSRAAII